ncbi:glycosyltransferase [Desulfurobacterium sp.]
MAKVSVVIPAYNRPEFLRQAMESVVNQSRKPDELIVVDDNPFSDENEKVVLEFADRFHFVKYFRNEENLGVTGNYARAIEVASGDYVKLLADDDILHPDALLLMEGILDNNPDCSVVASARVMVDKFLKADAVLSYKKAGKNEGRSVIIDSLRRCENVIGEFSSLLFRKSALDTDIFQFKGFHIKANADWHLWMYLASKGYLYYIKEPLVLFRYFEGNDQNRPDTFVHGLLERLKFVTDDEFHEHLGVKFPPRFQAESIARLVGEIGKAEKFLRRAFASREDLKCKWRQFKQELFRWMERLKQNAKVAVSDVSPKRPSVSVIIVTYNSERVIKYCLNSLFENLEGNDEIVVVDNNSRDGTLKLVKELAEHSPVPVKVVSLKENAGYSRGINIGISKADNDYFIFLNPDAIVTRGMIEVMLSALQRGKVGAVAPLSVNVSYTQHVASFVRGLDVLMSGGDFFEQREGLAAFLRERFRGEQVAARLLIGLCLGVKREVVEKLGGLDESLFLGMDDFEFSWRLRTSGYELKILPSAFVYHFGHASFESLPDKEEKAYQEEAARNLFDKLIDYYGFGNVPCVDELWNLPGRVFPVRFTEKKYNFMFNFSGSFKTKDWYKNGAAYLKTRPEIAVVIVSYFSSREIPFLFSSLKASLYPLKVVVVDNSENDEEFAALFDNAVRIFGRENVVCSESGETVNGRVVIVKNRNTGYAGGVNLGVKLVLENNIPFVWILNPDTAVAPNAAFELLKTSVYTGVPVVTCEIRDKCNPARIQYNGYIVDMSGVLDRAFYVKKVYYLSGANIFCRSDVFQRAGFFREDFFLYFEDNDFFRKLLNAGIHPVYTPYTFILHRGASTTGELWHDAVSTYYFVRNRLHFYRENGKSFPVIDLMELYGKLSHNKKLLKSLIEAVFDFSQRIYGKKDFSFLEKKNSCSADVVAAEYKSVNIDYSIRCIRDFLMRKPRKKVKFDEFLSLVEKKERLYG